MAGRVMSMVAMPLGLIAADTAAPRVRDESVRCLATEVHGKGWIVFAARSEKGDWDLFLHGPVVCRHGERPGAILDHRTSQCEDSSGERRARDKKVNTSPIFVLFLKEHLFTARWFTAVEESVLPSSASPVPPFF